MVVQRVKGSRASRNGGADAPHQVPPEFLEALGVAVYTTDANGIITSFNEAAVDLWGRRPEVGNDQWCGSWRLYSPDGTPLAHSECPMGVALKENRAVRGGQAIAERPDGTRVWFVAYPTPLRDDDGTLVGAVNVLVDVTEQREAQRALTEAVAVKDDFIGLVSHELRTPATTILGNAQILARRDNTLAEDERFAAIQDVHQEAVRLNRIIEDLLALARADAGKIECEPVSLTRVVEKIVRDYGKRSGRTIDLRLAAGAALIVSSEENLIRQVVGNYLSNAEKYSPPATPIEVVVDATDTQARVRVLDRGIGFDPDEVDLLFNPFYRSKNVGAVSGVGIGLSVCDRLVSALGGACWAAPRDGGGSEFGFSLPIYTP